MLAQNGVVRGRIADAAGAPSPGRWSRPKAAAWRATSDDQGRYEIRGLSSGAYLLRVRLLGYLAAHRARRSGPGSRHAGFRPHRAADQPVAGGRGGRVAGTHNRGGAARGPGRCVHVGGHREAGTNETSQILQNLAPSVNFPRQSVTDANDIVRPFTLRGLSPITHWCW